MTPPVIASSATEAAARTREEAEQDAERIRASALASVRELIELGKNGAVGELEKPFAELDRVAGADPGAHGQPRITIDRTPAEGGSWPPPGAGRSVTTGPA